MKAICRAASAAILISAFAALPALADTVDTSGGILADPDDFAGMPIPHPFLLQLTADRQQLGLAVQRLQQSRSTADQANLLADELAVAQAHQALLGVQLEVDGAREEGASVNEEAALQLRDQYLVAEQAAVAAQIALIGDVQNGDVAAVRVHEPLLLQARQQALLARARWADARAQFVETHPIASDQNLSLLPEAGVPQLRTLSAVAPRPELRTVQTAPASR